MKTIFTLFFSFLSLVSFSQTVGLSVFASGFSSPTEITHPVNDARLFIVQQGGIIKVLNPNGVTNTTPFLTLSNATISTGGERGLLGMAFHPNYATNGFFYLNFTNTAGNTVIARYSVSANPDVADSAGTIILTVDQPFSNHNGGSIKFGPDGYLYIGMGDGGSAGDPGNRAQNINENLGKMLRIDVDSASPYGIPPTNPYVGIDGNDEIWAVGVRNPWKFSFDRETGDLWIADVGQNQIEEINKITNPLPNNLNFGWKCYEGNSVFSTCTAPITYTFPIAQYTHSAGACSITGGYVYRGSLYPNFVGNYFFADYCNNKVGMVDSSGTITWSTAFSGNNITTFGEDINGELYVGGASGKIFRTIDSSLSVTNFDKNSISFYPNPAHSEIFFKTNSGTILSEVKICDVSGKVLLTENLENKTKNSINVASLANGIYLISAKDTAGNLYQSKIIID